MNTEKKNRINQLFGNGIAAHRDGKLSDARRYYHSVLELKSSHSGANHLLGKIALSENSVAIALLFFRHAIASQPDEEKFWESYILALIKIQQEVEAEAALEEAKKNGVTGTVLESLEKRLLIGRCEFGKVESRRQQAQRNILLDHYKNRRFDQAEKLSAQITKDLPKDPFAWSILASVLGATGRWAEALSPIQKAVDLSPEDARLHTNLGISLQELGRLEQAENSFKKAIDLKPDLAEAHNYLGNTLNGLNRLKDAEGSLRRAVALDPSYANAYNSLGNTLYALGKLSDAEASYNSAITLDPNSAQAYSNLGVTLQDLGRPKEALASYKKAISIKSDYAEAHNNLGNTLKELGKLEEAEASYTRAILSRPSYPEALSNLGATLYGLKRFDEAEATCKAALALAPDFSEAHKNLSKILLGLGRYQEGISEGLKGSGYISFDLSNGLRIL